VNYVDTIQITIQIKCCCSKGGHTHAYEIVCRGYCADKKESSLRWESMGDYAGMDFRIRCTTCDHQVWIPRVKLEKSIKKVILSNKPEEGQPESLAAEQE